MSESSILWSTNGTGDGAADITSSQWINFFEILFLSDKTTEGVAPRYLNALAVSSTGNNNARVATGGAVVRGFLYRSTANVDLTIPSPASDTGFRIVLRADWTLQTVRAAYVLNTTGVTDAPALTQVDGTTWEISLATGTITSGGVIAVTSAPTYLHYNTNVSTAMLEAASVTAAKIAAAVAGDGLAGGAGSALSVNVDGVGIEIDTDALRLKALGVTTAKLNDLAVTAGKIAADAVTTVKILDANVTYPKLADVYSDFIGRLGNSQTDWGQGGVTEYEPTRVQHQQGVTEFTVFDGDDYGGAVITFPTAFAGIPCISLSVGSCLIAAADTPCLTSTIAISASAMTIRAWRRDASVTTGEMTVRIHWQAWNGS